MSNDRIKRLIDEETEASELAPDAPASAATTVTRPNRARSEVYSIRLNPEEVRDLRALADAADVPASALARAWIVERIRDERVGVTDADTELRAAQRHLARLERQLHRPAS